MKLPATMCVGVIFAIVNGFTNCFAEAELNIFRIDIEQDVTNTCGKLHTNAWLNLTTNSFWGTGGVAWDGTNGLAILSVSSSNLVFDPKNSAPSGYIVRAYAADLTNCVDVATVNVVVAGMDIFMPKVIDSNETVIAEDDKLTKGCTTFVNLDNDDHDGKFDDVDDEVTGGDNELVKVRLRVTPATLDSGTVKVLTPTGGASIRIWKDDTKKMGYTPGVDIFSIPSDFAVESNYLMKTLWVEGIAPHTSQREALLAMEYSSEPASFVCTDKVSLTVIGIDKVEWQGRANSLDNSNVLDADPNWPTGLSPAAWRVFPDARATNGIAEPNARDKVDVKVTLSTAPPVDLKLYLKSFDVDDPTAANGPVDSPGTATNAVEFTPDDNRGNVLGKKAGMFTGQDANDIKELEFKAGDKTTNAEFQVTMQPGDNFRVAANADKDFLSQLENDDTYLNGFGADEVARNNDKQRIIDRAIAGNPVDQEARFSTKYYSDVLTVWRFLHVEVDSMRAPPKNGPEENTVEGNITGVAGDGINATRVYLSVNVQTGLTPQDFSANLDSATPGNGRFENGWIIIGTGKKTPGETTTTNLLGNGTNYVHRDTGIDIPFLLTKKKQPNLAGVRGQRVFLKKNLEISGNQKAES